MANQPYFPNREGDQLTWFSNISTKIATYYTPLELTAARTAKLQLTLAWLTWTWQTYLPARRQEGPTATSWRNQLASGTSDASTVTTPPAPAALTPPAGVPYFGMLTWLFEEIARWKSAEGYTDIIGQALGITGTQQSGPDLTTIQPVLALSIVGNSTNVGWGWQGQSAFLDVCELQVDRGAGWVSLAYDTTPNYIDTTPFPATPTKWKYRAIYRVGDHQVGAWSDTKEITVGG